MKVSKAIITFGLMVLALVLVIFLVGFPFLGKMKASSDDIWNYLIPPGHKSSVYQQLEAQWNSEFFRPLEIISPHLINPQTRDASLTAILHLPWLIVMLLALFQILKYLIPETRLALPLAIIFWSLHPGTSVSLWQADTISQTASGAIGIWLIIVFWLGLNRVKTRNKWIGFVLYLAILVLGGILAKEIFLGWILAGLGLGIIFYIKEHKNFQLRILSCLALASPLVLMPLIYLFFRIYLGGFLETQTISRYQIHIGTNIIKNLLLALLGYFSLGPVHAIKGLDTSIFVKSLPLAGILFSILIVFLAWLTSRRQNSNLQSEISSWRKAVILAFIIFLAISPCFFSRGAISELYLMGPNLGTAILISASLLTLMKNEKQVLKGLGIALTILGFIIGSIGLLSRARHFSITWNYSSELHQRLLQQVVNLPESNQKIVKIFLEQACFQGKTHSVYVVPPAQALNPKATEKFLNRLYPERKIILLIPAEGEERSPDDLFLSCSDFPLRPNW